jgi:hypothetical protein
MFLEQITSNIFLFIVGLFGIVFNRRNILIILMCIELLLLSLNLNFINGIANTFINCPFLVNELQVVGLSLYQPINSTNTNSQISYSTATFIGSIPATSSTFSGYIANTATVSIIGSISGTTLTVTVGAGINVGMYLYGGGVLSNTQITAFVSGTLGGAGNYTINNSQTVGSNTLTLLSTGTQLTVTTAPSSSLQITVFPFLRVFSSNFILFASMVNLIAFVAGLVRR